LRSERRYRRSLGVADLVSLGLGGTIGSGIFVVPGLAAGIAGAWSLLVWIGVGAAATCVALALAAVQAAHPTGVRFTGIFVPLFGRRAASALSGLYLVSSALGIATIAAGLGQYLAFLDLPAGTDAELAVLAAILLLNLAGVRLSANAENVLTAIKVLSIVGIALCLLPFVDLERTVPAAAVSATALMHAAIVVFWPFTGFEISAIPVEETRSPQRIRHALVAVMVLVCALYVLLNFALIGAVGTAALAASPAPVAYAVGTVFSAAGPAVAAIGIVTMLSALNAYVVGASRVLQDVAAECRVPGLAALSRRGVPARALVAIYASSAGLLFWSNDFGALATASVVSTLIPYCAICAAALRVLPSRGGKTVALAGLGLTAAVLILYFVL
jgi:amino acid transporter